MIAQDFARVSVLGAFSRGARGGTPRKKQQREGAALARDGSIATPYGVATMCAHAGKSAPQAAPSAPPVARSHRARARPAQFVPGRTSEKWDYLLKQKDIEIFDKRLGEMSGLDLRIAVVEERAPGIDDGAANSSVHEGAQLDDCRDQRGVPGEVRDMESLRSGLPRAEYVSGTP